MEHYLFLFHGVYVGLLAQERYQMLTPHEQVEVDEETIELLEVLMKNEYAYTEELYADIQSGNEVKAFLRYNANKALMNLGKEPYYPEEEVNPIVLNGLNTETKTFDFFSNKGNGYQKGIVEAVTDNTFNKVNDRLEKRRYHAVTKEDTQ